MFQYFLKVVSTHFELLDGQKVRSRRLKRSFFTCIDSLGFRSDLTNTVLHTLNVISLKGRLGRHKKAFWSHIRTLGCQGCSLTTKYRPCWSFTAKHDNRSHTSWHRKRHTIRVIHITLILLSFLFCRTCAIVGGVLTIASIIDSVLFATGRRLKKSGGGSGVSAYSSGKLM